MNSELPVSADALLAERARLEEELQSSEDWRELLRLKSRKDRGEPMSAVNTARLELVLIDALSQDPMFIRYQAVCVALERIIRGLAPVPPARNDEEAVPDDDLTQIRGVTPSMARRLKALDVTSFAQIAGWSRDDIQYISSELDIGRQIKKQRWVHQAQQLVGDTGYAAKAQERDEKAIEVREREPEPASELHIPDAPAVEEEAAPVVARGREDAPEPEVVAETQPAPKRRFMMRRFPKGHGMVGRLRTDEDSVEAVGVADEMPDQEVPPDTPVALEPAKEIVADAADRPDNAALGDKAPVLRAVVSNDIPQEAVSEDDALVAEVRPEETQPDTSRPDNDSVTATAAKPSSLPPPKPLKVEEYGLISATELTEATAEAQRLRAEASAADSAVVAPEPLERDDARGDGVGGLEKTLREDGLPQSLAERLKSATEDSEVLPDATEAAAEPPEPPPLAPPPLPLHSHAPLASESSMSITDAIAYAAEVAQKEQAWGKNSPTAKSDVAAEKAAPPPPPAPAAKPAPVSTVRYEPPKAATRAPSSPPPVQRPPARSRLAANGVDRQVAAPPPLPADFVAKQKALQEPSVASNGDGRPSERNGAGVSKADIEEATVEIVQKGVPITRRDVPRSVIRPAAEDVVEEQEPVRAATPIGRFLKALTGNQS